MDGRGIIPARAGFTGSCLRQAPGLTDHPRSRGVYSNLLLQAAVAAGSSPLARGLRSCCPGCRVCTGIIPARAGFTAQPRRARRLLGDHPRSRGVYSSVVRDGLTGWGSSPLARGLLSGTLNLLQVQGIIPARAGFTRWCWGRRRRRPDHPRSRGVYDEYRQARGDGDGSSPLARGLPPPRACGCAAAGIIPARAGFTRAAHARSGGAADHPRSRGVYCWGSPAYHVAVGSSPLARGLRRLCAPGDPHMRIIPARAGFTSCPWRTSGIASDHPRSRGVYEYDVQRLVDKAGSSPLARGLPGSSGPSTESPRIIPARAGFTRHQRARHRTGADHPRSRGVYRKTVPARAMMTGSSPLARGLRGGRRPDHVRSRIIPARAGFTVNRSEMGGYPWDHPRSRGVYTSWSGARPSMPGSSPLARGLRDRCAVPAPVRRIIPARAGFTRRRSTPPRGRRDHPRSRGVYVSGRPSIL